MQSIPLSASGWQRLAKETHLEPEPLHSSAFHLKSPADAKVLAQQLPPLMPSLFKRRRYHRHHSLLALHRSEREDSAISWRLRRRIRSAHGRSGQDTLGRCSMLIFQHVDSPPPTPVADQRRRLRRMGRRAPSSSVDDIYTAYPDVTAKEIKALASAADVSWCRCNCNPFLVILPIKSRLAFIEVELLLRARAHRTDQRPGQPSAHHTSPSSCPLRTTRGRLLYRV